MKCKVILLSLCTMVLLSGCIGGSQQESSAGVKQVTAGLFEMSVPAVWEQVPTSSVPTPSKGELALGFVSPDRREGYFNNLVVLEADNILRENSIRLMKGSESYLKGNLESFSITSRSNVAFADGDSGEALIYTASYNTVLPDLVYIQSAKSCGEKAYFMTLSVAEKLEDYSRYVDLLSSAKCLQN